MKGKRPSRTLALIELPHAAHFICGHTCSFKRATVVNERFIVSTVGEYRPSGVFEGGTLRIRRDADPIKSLGASPTHLYETMVFKAWRSSLKCCPFRQASLRALETRTYKTADAAALGHDEMVAQWLKVKGKRKP